MVECVFLIRAKDGLPNGAADTVVDHVWSLQYMVPHVLCASAGPLVSYSPGYGAGRERASAGRVLRIPLKTTSRAGLAEGLHSRTREGR